jgi:hypothetical protein
VWLLGRRACATDLDVIALAANFAEGDRGGG